MSTSQDGSIVHPTNIPRPPSLTRDERLSVLEVVRSEGWEIIRRIWSWQYQCAMVELMNAVDRHAEFQGKIKGMAGLMDGIEAYGKWAAEEMISKKPEAIPLTENEFFESWASKHKSTKDPISGY